MADENRGMSRGECEVILPSHGRAPQALRSSSSSPLQRKAVRIPRYPIQAPESVTNVQSCPPAAARGRRRVWG